MKDSFYFPHDYNATQDPKLMIVISRCGLAGIGFYWIIIEVLHQQENGKITQEAYDNYLKLYYKFDENQGQHVLNTIQQVLFDVELFQKDNEGNIFSQRVMKNKKYRKDITNKRSKAGKVSASKRKLYSKQSTLVEQVSTLVEQGKERKGKEIKGNKSNIEIENYLSLFNSLYKREYKPTEGRSRKLALRLKTYTWEQIEQSLRNMANQKWTHGDNQKNWVADPDYLIRSDEVIDKFLNVKDKVVSVEPDEMLKSFMEYDERKQNGF